MGEVQGSRGDICHCQHCQCTMSLSPFKNCIRDICPFDPFFRGNNCFKLIYLEITFTFYTYLWTSWIEATKPMGSMCLLTGWQNDVVQIFGTSRMLCGSVPQVNENIWEIFSPWMGRLWKWLFWSLLKRRASLQNFNFHSHPVCVFLNLNLLTNIMSARKARKNRRRWK